MNFSEHGMREDGRGVWEMERLEGYLDGLMAGSQKAVEEKWSTKKHEILMRVFVNSAAEDNDFTR